jgi:hypothetical protein
MIRKRRVSLFLIIRVFFSSFSIFFKMLDLGKKIQIVLYMLHDIRVSFFSFSIFLMLGLGEKIKLFFTYYMILEFLSFFFSFFFNVGFGEKIQIVLYILHDN